MSLILWLLGTCSSCLGGGRVCLLVKRNQREITIEKNLCAISNKTFFPLP